MRRVLAFVCSLVLVLTAGAMADSITFNGNVTASRTVEVYAPIGGTVDQVPVLAGEMVTPDTVLCTLKTNKVYATEDGVVTGIFGEPGDSAETVAAKYGAVMYIEGTERYTLSASVDNAYNAAENRFVHVGEKVYIVYRKNSTMTGEGIITAVNGTGYTVEVTEGKFLLGGSCSIYRDADHTNTEMIGRGTVSRRDPVAVTGMGSIVSIAVKDGDTVKKGDLLFETLDGSFDGLYMSGSSIYADTAGILSSVAVQQGMPVAKNSVAAVLYPLDAMQIKGSVSELDLADIAVGDKVTIEMNWNEDQGVTYEGTIAMISNLADAQVTMNGTTFTVYVDFTPDENTRYGMSAVITTED